MRGCHLTNPWGFVHVIEDLDSSVSFRNYRIAREHALHMLSNAMNFPRDIGGFFWSKAYLMYGSRDTTCDNIHVYDLHRGDAPTTKGLPRYIIRCIVMKSAG